MSHVTLLASDHPLPLWDTGAQRLATITDHGNMVQVEARSFEVEENSYYREAVKDLALPIKSFSYELDLEPTAGDLCCLREYLSKFCIPGEQVELWNLWVGGEGFRVRRFSGSFKDFDLEVLEQLFEAYQTCITITI